MHIRPKSPTLGRYNKKFTVASLNTWSLKSDHEAKISELRQQMIQEDIDLLALQETKIILQASEEDLRDFRLSDNTRCILSTAVAGLNGHVSGGLGFLISPQNASTIAYSLNQKSPQASFIR